MSAITGAVLENANVLAEQFRINQPFRHVEIPSFLRPGLCESLLRDFAAFDQIHALNESIVRTQ